jgi:hypothetical protein
MFFDKGFVAKHQIPAFSNYIQTSQLAIFPDKEQHKSSQIISVFAHTLNVLFFIKTN